MQHHSLPFPPSKIFPILFLVLFHIHGLFYFSFVITCTYVSVCTFVFPNVICSVCIMLLGCMFSVLIIRLWTTLIDNVETKGKNPTGPQPYTKNYRRLKSSESRRTILVRKSSPTGPMCHKMRKCHQMTRNIYASKI